MSQPQTMVDMDEALREAIERADRVEQEVARLKGHVESSETVETTERWRSGAAQGFDDDPSAGLA